mmetsp:Transcript_22515/g.67567  ORF Transcript_22515/g.67567 Transcript_22515/m.67567 type:complete len:350 (+) Transcript_22515:3815-4864(+)
MGSQSHSTIIPQLPGAVTTYRGRGCRADVRGLEANTIYKFTLHLMSPRSHSQPSPALEVWTAPTTPTAPVIARAESKAVVLKWYPVTSGADKYILECRFVDTLDDHKSNLADASRCVGITRQRTLTTTSVSEWKVCYEGRENTVRISELQPRAAYRFRVSALNGAGHPSLPSPLAQATTLTRRPSLIPRRAVEQFSLDAAGDIVVGDTILFTERIIVDRATGVLIGEPARGSVKSSCGAMSNGDRRSRNACGPKHIGDRTIAAHILAESFYAPKYAKQQEVRELRIQVVWCTISSNETAQYALQAGDVIQRAAAHILQFETFRCPWLDEHRRLSHYQERSPTLPITTDP